MGIALIIVGGIVLTSAVTAMFDYLGKAKKAAGNQELENRLSTIEKQFIILEDKLTEKDERIHRLETEVSFVNKLIENKTK